MYSISTGYSAIDFKTTSKYSSYDEYDWLSILIPLNFFLNLGTEPKYTL